MTFLYLNSDEMGRGDAALGKKLLLKFLEELAASDTAVDVIGCVNRGAMLTQKDGAALDSLRRLEGRGARIATCGTCLDHFGVRGSLGIGEIGGMDGTVRIMAGADRVIRPC
ncbi:hypothetical protein K8I85_19190 [bacterium]|nr:hypothetical protein [bacterium]